MGMTVGALREILDGIDDDDALVYVDGLELMEVRSSDDGIYLLSQDSIDEEEGAFE